MVYPTEFLSYNRLIQRIFCITDRLLQRSDIAALGFSPPPEFSLPDFSPPEFSPPGLFPAYPEIDILFFKCIFHNAYWYMNIYYRQ